MAATCCGNHPDAVQVHQGRSAGGDQFGEFLVQGPREADGVSQDRERFIHGAAFDQDVLGNFLSQVIGTRRVATARTLSMLVQGFGAMIRRSGYRFIAYGADRHKRWAGNRQVPGPAQ